MNGLIGKKLAAAGLASAALSTGCYGYRDLVDPCYPQRYEYAARQEVKAAFGPQVMNGHILDQTVWNYQFEPGTAALTPGGMEHLATMARRRPCPDTTVYLQVAQDVGFDPGSPMAFAEARSTLDSKRTQAILDYLAAQTAGRPVTFNVVRHDPAEVGMSAVEAGVSVRQMQTTSQGILVKPVSGSGNSGGH